ncbi:MAG: AAA family ATPase [Desulfatiglandaceae bacterium]
MYTAFFGFGENPFNLTPDPRYLFLSRYHREALEHLLYGINERKGFIAITGGIGTGKTTLCRALLEHLDPNIQSALVFSSFISEQEILQTVNQEFGIEMDPEASSRKDYVDALNAFLLKNFRNGGNALLLIDEAQNLSRTVLEQIRMLSNLETEKEKLLQVVLVGQSELKGLLGTAALRQLNERITVRYDLGPLDEADLRGYVHHRLTVAGGKGDVSFSNGALKAVYAYSKGNPRRINAVCDRALLIAFTGEKRVISKRMLKDAIRDLRGRSDAPRADRRSWLFHLRGPAGRWVAATAVLLVGILVAGFLGWYPGGILKDIFSKTNANEVSLPSFSSPAVSSRPDNPDTTMFLNDTASLAGLFRPFERETGAVPDHSEGDYLGLVSFNVPPEYFPLFKRPFRVVVDTPPGSGSPPRYLLITETGYDRAVALDKEGTRHELTRAFVFSHWGGTVSFVYPHNSVFQTLSRGMKGEDVLRIQRLLERAGYIVEQTAVYDQQTVQAVTRFQKEFGLKADGIIGPRTMALMFQMADPGDELHS